MARRGTCFRLLSLRIDLYGKLRRPAQMEESIAEILANALAPWGVQFVEVEACLDPIGEDDDPEALEDEAE